MAKKNSNVKQRKEKILNFMKVAGAWRVTPNTVKELSKQFEVTERQIYLDIKSVIRKIPKPVVSETANKFLISWDYAIDKAIESMRSNIPDVAMKGVKLFTEVVEKYTQFMHQYGFKEQIAEKLDINQQGTIIQLVEKSVEEIKDEKNNNKSEAERNTESP